MTAPSPSKDLVRKVVTIVATVLELKPEATEAADFLAQPLSMDDLTRFSLVLAIEEEFDVPHLPHVDAASFVTAQDIITYLVQEGFAE